jgi:prepilin-type N-terminal cleavage/methylation domain-containing protein
MRTKKGFTLIELSLVLVIIGLLVAGVLVGKTLIKSAEIRAQLSQIEKLSTTVQAFRGKYNCLPGDCANAVALGLGLVNGNGNKAVDTACDVSDGPEIQNFWYNLGVAKLIDAYPLGNVPGINSPPLKLRGKALSGNTDGGVWLAYYAKSSGTTTTATSDAWLLTSDYSGGPVYLGAETFGMDSKIDDGKPLTGKMRADSDIVAVNLGTIPHECNYNIGVFVDPDPGDPLCYDVDNNFYDVNNTAIGPYALCLPRIRANW